MNYGSYQPGMMPNYPQPMLNVGTGQYPNEPYSQDQIMQRLTSLERQLTRLETRISRLETPFQETPSPEQQYPTTPGYEMPESTYPSNMHMM